MEEANIRLALVSILLPFFAYYDTVDDFLVDVATIGDYLLYDDVI